MSNGKMKQLGDGNVIWLSSNQTTFTVAYVNF